MEMTRSKCGVKGKTEALENSGSSMNWWLLEVAQSSAAEAMGPGLRNAAGGAIEETGMFPFPGPGHPVI
jgi:hypothetical protein